MKLYNNFVGIDIGKVNFVVGVNGKKEVREYENNCEGMERF